MRINAAGIGLIRHFEGTSLKAYRDPAGLWTVGTGHLIRPNEGHLLDGVTEAQAEALLRDDLREAERAVANAVHVPLTENQRGALTSMCFNVGAGAFRGSTLVKKLNNCDYAGAANEFTRWSYVKRVLVLGLLRRRRAEKALFLSPSIGAGRGQ